MRGSAFARSMQRRCCRTSRGDGSSVHFRGLASFNLVSLGGLPARPGPRLPRECDHPPEPAPAPDGPGTDSRGCHTRPSGPRLRVRSARLWPLVLTTAASYSHDVSVALPRRSGGRLVLPTYSASSQCRVVACRYRRGHRNPIGVRIPNHRRCSPAALHPSRGGTTAEPVRRGRDPEVPGAPITPRDAVPAGPGLWPGNRCRSAPDGRSGSTTG
jgi:hypothetical protein